MSIKHTTLKRLFFAFKVRMPWPHSLPHARILNEEERHMTVAFLGETDFSTLQPLLATLPLPAFKVGLTAATDHVLFLPERHPRVIAWHIADCDQITSLANYSTQLNEWLQQHAFSPKSHPTFLPHLTIGRAPFNEQEWVNAFDPLPLIIESFHLYESLGQLKYQSLWSHEFVEPFLEIDHIADIAFKIRGESIQEIYENSFTALAFKYPILLDFKLNPSPLLSDIDDVIIALNQIISRTDSSIGCPFKAISFHGEIKIGTDNILNWEMIVDV